MPSRQLDSCTLERNRAKIDDIKGR